MSVQSLNAARLAPPATHGRMDASPVDPDVFDDSVRLHPAKGILHGLLIALPFWMLVGVALWLWL